MIKRTACLFLALLTVLALAVPAIADEAAAEPVVSAEESSVREDPAPAAPAEQTGLPAPVLRAASCAAGGVEISWDAVPGAAGYRVFYKSGSTWKRIGDASGTSFIWSGAQSGKRYTFTVRCVSADGASYTSAYDKTGKSVTYIAAPVLTGVSAAASGVQIKWNKVSGAAKYRVFYKTTGGWTRIGDTTGSSFTWSGAQSGTAYSFTVRCISSNGKTYTSAYDPVGLTLAYVGAPVIRAAKCAAGGVEISWDAVPGAAGYRVFYKSGNTWKRIGDASGTSFIWSGAQSGKRYTFTVRCVSADGASYTSAYDKTGKSVTYIAAPVLTGVSAADSGVQIKWNKVSGAAKYRVFYKTTGGWTRIGDTTGSSFTWSGAQSGTAYAFTVRCISSNGKTYTSAYDPVGLTLTHVGAPVIRALNCTAAGIQVLWDAVPGAENYRVYYKSGGAWKRIGDTTGTNLTWSGAQSGTTYTFTVRCISRDGKHFASAYDKTGKTITYITAPEITALESTARGVQVQWTPVPGAAKYRVFYKTTGDWIKAGDTTGSSFIWTGAQVGTAYAFTVRCLASDGETYVGAYDDAGKTITYTFVATRPLDNVGRVNGLNQGSRGCCMATSFSMAANLILGRNEYGAFDWTAGPYNDSLNVGSNTRLAGSDGHTYRTYSAGASSTEELRTIIDSILAGGCPVVASVHGTSTASTHYVVVVGWTDASHSDYLIVDPANAGSDTIEKCAIAMAAERGYGLGNRNGTFVYLAFSRTD